MNTLYSNDTVATAVAIQEMNMSFALLVILGIALLWSIRAFASKSSSRPVVCASKPSDKRTRKLPRVRAMLRRLFRSVFATADLQLQVYRQSLMARKALRSADSTDAARSGEMLPSTIGDYTPIAPNGKPWDQYDEPAFIRKGVQLSF